MNKLYTASEIGRMIGVTPDTIKNWEKMRVIPQSSRIGLTKKRIWGQLKLRVILSFAKDQGYQIPYLIEEVKDGNKSKTQ